MSDEFATFNLDKPPVAETKSNEQMRRHSVDSSLETKPIERALHLLMVGEEIQKLSVIHSLPVLLGEDSKGCIQKIIPKMNQGLLQGSTEYHFAASSAVKAVVVRKLIPPDQIVQSFLRSVLNCVDNRDPEVSKVWFETLLELIGVLPVNLLLKEVLATAISKSDGSKSLLQRLMSCRILGRIAHSCDAYVLRKDVFPVMQALTQDSNKDVRAAICLEFSACASGLAGNIDKDLLPILNDFANDDDSIVRVAAYQTMVDIIPYLSAETLRNNVLPFVKKMIDFSLTPNEDELKVIVSKNFGKACVGLEKVTGPADKMWMTERFAVLAQLGLPNLKFRDRIIQRPTANQAKGGSGATSLHVECRMNCAYNFPAILQFASDLDKYANALYPVLSDLTSDPYFHVRRTVGSGIHEVAKTLGKENSIIVPEVIKLLRDDVEEVLGGVLPHLKDTFEALSVTKAINSDLVDEVVIEVAKALVKCELEIASSFNWRLHVLFFEQLEVLPKCFPSDFIYHQFYPLIYKKILSCRPRPCRLAAFRTVLVFLRYNLRVQQRGDMRVKLITDFCQSSNYYHRMLFIQSSNNMIDLFSSNYFRENFFPRIVRMTGIAHFFCGGSMPPFCTSLVEDKVANVRLIAYSMLPQLKMIAKGERGSNRFLQMIDTAISRKSMERDRDVVKCIISVIPKLEKIDSVPYKADPKDIQKFEEEKYLSTVNCGKEWKISTPLSATARFALVGANRPGEYNRPSPGPLPATPIMARMDSTRFRPGVVNPGTASPFQYSGYSGSGGRGSFTGGPGSPTYNNSAVMRPAVGTVAIGSPGSPRQSEDSLRSAGSLGATSGVVGRRSPDQSFSSYSSPPPDSTSPSSLTTTELSRCCSPPLDLGDESSITSSDSNNIQSSSSLSLSSGDDSCSTENVTDNTNSSSDSVTTDNGDCNNNENSDDKISRQISDGNDDEHQETITPSSTVTGGVRSTKAEKILRIPVRKYTKNQKRLLRRHSSSLCPSSSSSSNCSSCDEIETSCDEKDLECLKVKNISLCSNSSSNSSKSSSRSSSTMSKSDLKSNTSRRPHSISSINTVYCSNISKHVSLSSNALTNIDANANGNANTMSSRLPVRASGTSSFVARRF